MRVTSSTFPTALRNQLTNLATKQARLQTQAGTGQRFHVSSEDPRAMRRVLDMQGEIKLLGQYEKNISTLRDTVDSTYVAITGIKKVSDRAGEIATRVDSLKTPEELVTFATEVDQLIERTLQISNTRHHASYLFGGTKSSTLPFNATRDADGKVVSVAYQGSSTVAESEIGEGIKISAMIPGANASGVGERGLLADPRSGADFFAHLIALRDNLQAGNAETINKVDLGNLLKDEENIIHHYGGIGATQSRLDTASSIANRQKASLEGLVSQEADADLSLTLVYLSEVQNAYTAALQTGGKILGTSLLDYIR